MINFRVSLIKKYMFMPMCNDHYDALPHVLCMEHFKPLIATLWLLPAITIIWALTDYW